MTLPCIRVAFADDHPLIRSLLRTLLTHDTSLHLVGEAANGTDLIQVCNATAPEVISMDLHMPGISGVTLVRTLLHAHPLVKIIVVTAAEEEVYLRAMATLPIVGYLLKDEAIDHLLAAIHAVVEGRRWFSSRLLSRVTPSQTHLRTNLTLRV